MYSSSEDVIFKKFCFQFSKILIFRAPLNTCLNILVGRYFQSFKLLTERRKKFKRCLLENSHQRLFHRDFHNKNKNLGAWDAPIDWDYLINQSLTLFGSFSRIFHYWTWNKILHGINQAFLRTWRFISTFQKDFSC